MPIVRFAAFGLEFEADVQLSGENRPGTYWDPPEYEEMEILSLTHCDDDASFMLKSDYLSYTLEDEAYKAIEDYYRKQQEELEADKYSYAEM